MNQDLPRRKVIVITGCTRGLGRALAGCLAERGHTVVGCGRSRSGVHELHRTFGFPHSFTVVDVSSDLQVRAWAKQVLANYGPPDMLINNAGAANSPRPLWEVSSEEFSRVVDVNIKGIANTVRYFVPAMIQCRKGVVVNFSSEWGRTTSAGVAPYCGSKWAVEGLTKALAMELPEGLTAVAYSPGIVCTDMLRLCFGDAAAQYPSPEQWAEKATPHLLSLGAKQNGRSLAMS